MTTGWHQNLSVPYHRNYQISEVCLRFFEINKYCRLISHTRLCSVYMTHFVFSSNTDTAMETRIASHRHSEAGLVEHEPHKDLSITDSYILGQRGVECSRLQVQFEAQNEMTGSMPKTAQDISVALPPDTKIEQVEKPVGPPVEGNDRLQSISMEKD